MRGFPLLQTILVVLAVLLAGVPVYRLTRPAVADAALPSMATPSVEATPIAATQAAPLGVGAVFAPAPTDFQVKNLGQTVLAGRGPQAQFTAKWATVVPPEGVDLVIQARWPAAAADGGVNPGTSPAVEPRAMRVMIRFPDGVLFERTFWANVHGELNEVCTVPASPGPD